MGEVVRKSAQLLLVPRDSDDTEGSLRQEAVEIPPRISLLAPDGTIYKVEVVGTAVSTRGIEAQVVAVLPLWKMPLLMLGVCGLITLGLSFVSTPPVWGILLSWLLGPMLVLTRRWLGDWLDLRYLRQEFRRAMAESNLKEAVTAGKIIPFPGSRTVDSSGRVYQ